MSSRWQRPAIYILLIAVFFVGVEIQKSRISSRNSAEISTILSEHLKNGSPVDVMNVSSTRFTEMRPVTLTPCSWPEVCFQATADLRRELRVGSPLFDVTGKNRIGSVTRVAGQVDFTTALFPVRARMNSDVEKPSSFLTGQLQLATKPQAIVVPIDSVETEGRSSTVWVLEENLPKKREVKVGTRTSHFAEILGGLREGDVLIVEGQRALMEGQKIQIRKTFSLRDLTLTGGLL